MYKEVSSYKHAETAIYSTEVMFVCVSGVPVCFCFSDYKGWTCLHHAAAEGYTQTMDILLSANPKLLDKTDEDGV